MSEAARNLMALGALSLAERIAKSHGITLQRMLSKERVPRVVAARHELWFVLHGTLGLGLAELGRTVGADHTTVRHALEKRERELRG